MFTLGLSLQLWNKMTRLLLGICLLILILGYIGTAVGSTSYLNMMDNCGNAIRKKDSYALRSHDDSEVFNNTSGMRVTCTVQVQALRSDQMLSFRFLDLTIDDPSNDNTCSSTYVAVWDGQSKTNDDLLDKFCINSTSSFQTITQFAVVTLSVAPGAVVNVTLLYTSFTSGTCTDSVYELQCDNGRCVPRSVRCDRFNNCGDGSDQRVGTPSYCPYRRKKTTPVGTYIWWILLVLIGVFLLSYILYWLCWRPGYIPWRLACCRNFCKNCFVGCCRTCCSKCKCRGCLRKFGRRCQRCCQGRKGRSKNQDGSEASFIGNGAGNVASRGYRGGEGDWTGMGLVTRGGKGSNSKHAHSGGGMFGDYDYFNGDGAHARESR